MLAEHVGTALDVGCGTGKVAVELRRRRVSVLGVDPDPRMAGVAVGHGVDVEVSELERWEDGGRRFDLITSGHAWHWVDLSTGADTAARAASGRHAAFVTAAPRNYRWRRRLTSDQWSGLLATFGDHQQLGPPTR